MGHTLGRHEPSALMVGLQEGMDTLLRQLGAHMESAP